VFDLTVLSWLTVLMLIGQDQVRFLSATARHRVKPQPPWQVLITLGAPASRRRVGSGVMECREPTKATNTFRGAYRINGVWIGKAQISAFFPLLHHSNR
jgi:hypothetical protein